MRNRMEINLQSYVTGFVVFLKVNTILYIYIYIYIYITSK